MRLYIQHNAIRARSRDFRKARPCLSGQLACCQLVDTLKQTWPALALGKAAFGEPRLSLQGPDWVLCHEHHRSKRRCGTVREMKEGPSGSAIRSLIPSHRKLLWSKVTVVSVAETPGR